MKLYISDISLFDGDFFEKADFVPRQKKKDLASYSHTASKREHILAWSMLAYAYKAETGKSVSEIELYFSEKGKPYLEQNPFFFSLSHSGGRVLCAVGDKEIGADVQTVRPVKDSLVKRVLCENERKIYEAHDNKPLCFTKLWTLKESYLKYTGEGIAAGLDGLDFSSGIDEAEFMLFGKNFSVFADGDFTCCVCSDEKKVRMIHLDQDSFGTLKTDVR